MMLDMESVFKALADPSRRKLLDLLFERDGQTLTELAASLPAMTRFGVMKHLGLLEQAGPGTSRRGRRGKGAYRHAGPAPKGASRWCAKTPQGPGGPPGELKLASW